MHFFSPNDVDDMFKKSKDWLVDNGQLHLVVMSPYHYALKGFATIYDNRWREGQDWPGIITTMTKDYIPENKGKIPEFLHVMEARVLTKLASKHGFVVKKMELFGHNRTKKENGLGYIGAILIKKAP